MVLRFSSTCTVDQMVHWVNFGITMCSWNVEAGLIKPAAQHCLPTDTGLDPSTKHATEPQ